MIHARDSASDIASALTSWFALHARTLPWRSDYDPWHVWVSEVMLQQTRMDVVLPYFARFIAKYPTPRALAASEEEEVLSLWSGLGYYRRARLLREGAIAVTERFGGRIPADAAELRALPGIGRYTAGAISSTAFNRREPIVDGNVERLLSRVAGIADPRGSAELSKKLWAFSEELVRVCSEPRAMNQAMMEVGSRVCSPRAPRCGECPVQPWCTAAASGDPERWPRRQERQEINRLRIPLLISRDGVGRVLLVRCEGPLLGGMYHLPHGTHDLIPSLDLSSLLQPVRRLGVVKHSITNRRLEFVVFEAELRHEAGSSLAESAGALWIHPEELASVPHPSYVSKALSCDWSGGESPIRGSASRMRA